MTLGEVGLFSGRQFLESGLLSTLLTAGKKNPLVLKAYLSCMSQNPLYKWSWDAKLGCLASEFRSFTIILYCSVQIILSSANTLGWMVNISMRRLKIVSTK